MMTGGAHPAEALPTTPNPKCPNCLFIGSLVSKALISSSTHLTCRNEQHVSRTSLLARYLRRGK